MGQHSLMLAKMQLKIVRRRLYVAPTHGTVSVQNVGKGNDKMELIHRAVTSPIFELMATYEIDISLKGAYDDDSFSLRIELFRSLGNKKLFRYKTWRNELVRIQSTFPQDNSGESIHGPSDENILVGFSARYFAIDEEIIANSPEEALRQIIDHLGKMLEHITSERLTIVD
ncbi:MAG: hypothetical protein HQK56_21135 [Deltaproteobacteria bacterium]|nr:hypothetical protein [Deltaproteobacteria bacterium]